MNETEKLKKAFSLFVGTDELRPALLKPFKQNGFYFSTDAHSLIMAPENLDLGYSEQQTPDCLKVFPKDRNDPIEISIAHIEKILLEKTPLIDETIECSSCDGFGTEECNLGHDHDCEDCDGKGYFPTGNGKKVHDKYARKYLLDGQHFQFTQLKRLIDACEILGFEDVNKVSGKDVKPLLLKKNDVTFLIMPTIIDGEDVIVDLSSAIEQVLKGE